MGFSLVFGLGHDTNFAQEIPGGFIHEDMMIFDHDISTTNSAFSQHIFFGFKHSDRVYPDSESDACGFHPDSTGVSS